MFVALCSVTCLNQRFTTKFKEHFQANITRKIYAADKKKLCLSKLQQGKHTHFFGQLRVQITGPSKPYSQIFYDYYWSHRCGNSYFPTSL